MPGLIQRTFRSVARSLDLRGQSAEGLRIFEDGVKAVFQVAEHLEEDATILSNEVSGAFAATNLVGPTPRLRAGPYDLIVLAQWHVDAAVAFPGRLDNLLILPPDTGSPVSLIRLRYGGTGFTNSNDTPVQWRFRFKIKEGESLQWDHAAQLVNDFFVVNLLLQPL